MITTAKEATEQTENEQIQPDKPPLGARPYYIAATERIQELIGAINRYMDQGITQNYRQIRVWAREICEQCDLVEWMNDV